jgi:spore germination protein GerM
VKRSLRKVVIPSTTAVAIGGFVLAGIALAWLLFVGLPRWFGSEAQPATTTASTSDAETTAETPTRRINARLFYVGASGGNLLSVEHEVPFAEDQIEQARAILRAQLEPPEPPHTSAIPEGTELRAVFLTPRGEAYVDLSQNVVTGHAGGSVNELLTVYTIVHALTTNLPAVTSVQILVEGREVETLAGHVNLQRPLTQNPDWTQ